MPDRSSPRESHATPHAPTAGRDDRRDRVWLGAILLLALALRLYDLEAMDIWVDEANGILTRRGSFAVMREKL